MDAIIHRINESNLSDFKGLAIEGEIPVSEDILNDMIQMVMKKMQSSQSSPTEKASAPSSGESIDFGKILSSLDEKDVKISFKEKFAILKLTARKY